MLPACDLCRIMSSPDEHQQRTKEGSANEFSNHEYLTEECNALPEMDGHEQSDGPATEEYQGSDSLEDLVLGALEFSLFLGW